MKTFLGCLMWCIVGAIFGSCVVSLYVEKAPPMPKVYTTLYGNK